MIKILFLHFFIFLVSNIVLNNVLIIMYFFYNITSNKIY